MNLERQQSVPTGESSGFRLHRFEVYNWGTFDQQVFSICAEGKNSLLTGDIGSGKSTLVDALTTLLVAPQKITYNRAAGAESRERTLRSYVQGHYKSEIADGGLSARPVALRDHNSYSVILGHFRNVGYEQDVTLAQVFWTTDPRAQPDRLYVVADVALEIAEHFAGFGAELSALKRRLRKMIGVETAESFPPYAAAFRRRLGIESEQAMDLFNQTISMKSVGNLTDFVRTHMLEGSSVENRIAELIKHFDDLNRAHEAVLKAKAQIEALTPLVSEAGVHERQSARIAEWSACRAALPPWFATLKLGLLETRLEALTRELENIQREIESLENRRDQQQTERDDLKRAIAENGGDRIERIGQQIAVLEREKAQRLRDSDRYRSIVEPLGLQHPSDALGFEENRRAVASERQIGERKKAEALNRLTELEVELRGLKGEHDEIQTELNSLRSRRSNIPANILELRRRVCGDLGIEDAELPFAGELLQVREEERDWEGAAERLLHNFGLSMLVPNAHYPGVAEWVDKTNLRGRFVYYRVTERPAGPDIRLHPQSLVRKIAIHPESDVYGWLESELGRRFDYACCNNLEAFRREQRAITRAGQIKGSGERHEKDDRHRIDDRSRYILGWSNEAKIAALEDQARGLEARIQEVASKLARTQSTLREIDARLLLLSQLVVFPDFAQLDWRALAFEMERLEQERRALEAASDVLRTLQAQLTALEASMAMTQQGLKEAQGLEGQTKTLLGQAMKGQQVASELTNGATEEMRTQRFPALEVLRPEALENRPITLDSCEQQERRMGDWLQSKIDHEGRQAARLRDGIIKKMEAYRNAYPLETQEVDASIEAAHEYEAMLVQLQTDDLPRFESRFRDLLNENAIREVAGFHSHLRSQSEVIRDRIQTINQSLRAIDYNPGRYIMLLAESSGDPEVRDFQQDLRACTEGALGGTEDVAFAEQKFLQVRRIIERFRGREGTAELDKRWTKKVSDVRNWFVFSASERWKEGDAEHEHYSDSGGKSGGQKEKLAYTVLAASLAYQFRLELGEERSRSFRFVVIDEAFGRGSDESARYGLALFARLQLQLLIVTPLQKIHVIEPFVSSVGFVHNTDGARSMLRTLTIEEYRAEKAARSKIVMLS